MLAHAEAKEPKSLRFGTYNIACLPRAWYISQHANNDVHPTNNLLRADLIAEKLLSKNYDVIALQEVWDPAVAKELQATMEKHGYECVRGTTEKEYFKFPINIVPGGLMIFTRLHVVDLARGVFPMAQLGEEIFAYKGFLAVKLKINKNEYAVFYVTHLHADGCWYPLKLKSKKEVCSKIRNEQMKFIRVHMNTWERIAPQGLSYHCTFLMGDFNVPLNDKRRMLSIRVKKEAKEEVSHSIRRLHQFLLFSKFELTVPENFVESRETPRSADSGTKKLLPEFEKEVHTPEFKSKFQQKFFGTYKDKKFPILGTQNILDGIFASLNRRSGQLHKKIISMESDRVLSDHLPIEATYYPDEKYVPEKQPFELHQFELKTLRKK